MNTFSQAGEALLQAQDGNRLIARALWDALKIGATRAITVVRSSFSWAPGPHLLP